ncbi:hypothetical protein ABZ345_47360 [Lentzea sp. NPDC005914]|uniref:hypothetical protein n=1 Tax=Lentzea sp. NPDC005914 TaxID=3154572 RepID=UPI0033F69CBD
MHSDHQVVWAAVVVSLAIIVLIGFVVWRLGTVGRYRGLVRVLAVVAVAIAVIPAVIDALQL